MKKQRSIAIVGPGKLGSALAAALHDAGYRIDEIVLRDNSRRQKAAARLTRKLHAVLARLSACRLNADVVWICVPDDAIGKTAAALAPRVHWAGKIALHSAGALTSRLQLRALKRRGAAIGSAHPMMTFAQGAPKSWRGIPFAVEGDAAAVAFAREVARRLELVAFAINPRSKPLYHLLGSLSSPLLVSLLSVAERVARAAKIKRPAREILGAILAQTVEHYRRGGLQAAFAGPLLRGDLGTIRGHLENLRRVPGALQVYRTLSLEAADHLPVKRRADLQRLLRRGTH